MIKKLLSKLIVFITLIVGISFLSFSLSYLAPSDAAQVLLEKKGMVVTEEALEAKREELGLDRPMLVQYADWLIGICEGDFGTSFNSGRTVTSELMKALPNTIILTILSSILSCMISIPAGIFSAKYKDGIFDNIVRFITYLFASLPNFFIALVLLYVLALKLHLFNVIGGTSMKDIIMPVIVLALTMAAWHTRQVRAVVLKEYDKDYVLGSRARGVKESDILRKHVLKNSLIPIITLIGISFGGILGGSVI
ncbi:MAG: ABC transporter permease, partial [Intestinibacter sp.]|uniref:ABC transporter permease n=1 Tax=Intestinibacter sp. TaxID=1965304 RepID=UPI003F178C74